MHVAAIAADAVVASLEGASAVLLPATPGNGERRYLVSSLPAKASPLTKPEFCIHGNHCASPQVQ